MQPSDNPFGGATSSHEAATPTACPSCGSSTITTTARTPDQNSYWRCVTCGEIWNNARRDSRPRRRQPWSY
jgi:predicted RNA-binding Zn-ribbon protein involved in translation (DUF1610 family)